MPDTNETIDQQPTKNKQSMSTSEVIDALMDDIRGYKEVDPHDIGETIKGILQRYNLSTNTDFISSLSKLNYTNPSENMDVDSIPKELRDAAFLPVEALSYIAQARDIEMLISQIPEWAVAAQLMRDCVCESDVSSGQIAKSLTFGNIDSDEAKVENARAKIAAAEERLEIDALIKHGTYEAILQGRGGFIYRVPYAKIFSDLARYKNKQKANAKKDPLNIFNRRNDMCDGMYGYNEYAIKDIEKSLSDVSVIVQETAVPIDGKLSNVKKVYEQKIEIFTESEMKEINPDYKTKGNRDPKVAEEEDAFFEECVRDIANKISYVESDVSLPILDQTADEIEATYHVKYKDEYGTPTNIFEQVISTEQNEKNGDMDILPEFRNIKGLYTRVIPSTKLFPISVDRTVIGYYYISDQTRPDDTTDRKNGRFSGYMMKSSPNGNDTFSPDKLFYEKMASKIINNFDMKFVRNNVGLHKEIVTILEAHNFNDALMRFIFIPAEHVTSFTIRKDGSGCGHSMFEDGLPVARMYMFLKMYCILFQINNGMIRVIKLRTSGIDKNYKNMAEAAARKFMSRRIVANDMFNFRSSLAKVTGGSDLLMMCGPDGIEPISFDTIAPAEMPINTELMTQLKNETINAQPVPAATIMGAMNEMDFAKEVELANTRLTTFASSYKIDLNPSCTELYREIIKWETDIDDPELIKNFHYKLKEPTAKALVVTNDMINNFNNLFELSSKMTLTAAEIGKDGELTHVSREFMRLLANTYLPNIDIDIFLSLADKAREKGNEQEMNDLNNPKRNPKMRRVYDK